MIDTALFTVVGGRGGDGSASYLRMKYNPKGGPDGGDGGDGGSVYLAVDPHLNTLRDYAGKTKFQAQDGQHGQKRQKFGAKGADLVLSVPPGTLVWEIINAHDYQAGAKPEKKLLAEMVEPDERRLLVPGGQGGRGNVHFKSATNRTPLEFERGGVAPAKLIFLELKLLADAGLIGLPNAGKSTLLSVLTKARPKIANYPFTTLDPHLGVLEIGDQSDATRVVLADIPGLVEDAAQGKGLGHQFLRHIERCRVLVYVLALTEADLATPEPAHWPPMLVQQWQLLRDELVAYQADLGQRPYLIVVNKMDLLSADDQVAIAQALAPHLWSTQSEVIFISAATQAGLRELSAAIAAAVQEAPVPAPLVAPSDKLPVFSLEKSGQPQLDYRAPLYK